MEMYMHKESQRRVVRCAVRCAALRCDTGDTATDVNTQRKGQTDETETHMHDAS